MQRKQLPAIFLQLILISLSSIGCIKQEYRNSNYDLKNPFIKLSTDSADIPVITETSFFDFNSKNGPEYWAKMQERWKVTLVDFGFARALTSVEIGNEVETAVFSKTNIYLPSLIDFLFEKCSVDQFRVLPFFKK